MDLGLNGKTALITGSTQGIGRAIAETFAREGAKVIINGRDAERTMAVASALGGVGIVADVATEEGCNAMLSRLSSANEVDILINNAGYFDVKPLEDLSDQDWLDMFQLNVMSGVRLTKALGMFDLSSR
jgi:NAD(P)-dependent dehydrogenase (short-subunit alcohol dehydrogenase family)